MSCRISDTEWTDYLDNGLAARERQAVEAHLAACADCSSRLAEFRQVDQRLRIECGKVLKAIGESGVIAVPSRESILAVLRDGVAVVNPQQVQERLWRVRWVLALLCGSNTAVGIIRAAESRAKIPGGAKPNEQKWLVFLRRLSSLTTEICGRAAGELIWAVGN